MAAIDRAQNESAFEKYAKYVDDPVGFSRDVLGVELVPLQQKALTSLLEPPYRTLCPSANEVGKSIDGACAILWWHCTRIPSVIITTAPKFDQVKDILWKEVRSLARRAQLPLAFLPKTCRIERSSEDFAVGLTAKDATSFQGHHGPSILFVIDEGTGVAAEFFEAIESMFSPPGHAVLCLFNPTAIGSRVHAEMMGADKLTAEPGKAWHIVRMSAIEHPNINAELRSEKPPVPHAIRLDKFDRLFRKWSQLVGCDVGSPLQLATDIVWPPEWATEFCERTKQRPRVWRPGPVAEARLLGRFARQGTNSVWSEGDWIAATREGLEPLPLKLEIPEIGCDVAAGGDDNTSFHVRCGFCSLFHEESNGLTGPQVAARLQELCETYAKWFNDNVAEIPDRARPELLQPEDIPIKIDSDGIGARDCEAMEDQGYRVVRVGAGTKALDEMEFPNRRSELWFTVAEMARADELDFSRLPEEVLDDCRRQFLSVTWSLDGRGRRVVMPKDEMRQVMGRSPDTADSINLAYAGFDDQSGGQPFILYKRHRATD